MNPVANAFGMVGCIGVGTALCAVFVDKESPTASGIIIGLAVCAVYFLGMLVGWADERRKQEKKR